MSIDHCNRCGEQAAHIDLGFSPAAHGYQHDCGGTWVAGPASAHCAHPANKRSSADYPFSGPIYGAEENRAAHGNIRVVERCECGATRNANVNGRHVEQGPWVGGER